MSFRGVTHRLARSRTAWGVLSVAILGTLLATAPAHAQVGYYVSQMLAGIAQVLIELVGKLLIVLIEILLAVVEYNDFINAPAVVKSWVLVRDFANMAFLIIFIAIAFATILGVERYEWKRLLPKLLMMAVVINFSKTISGVVIDAAQVVMMTFVNGFRDVAAGNLIRGFGLNDMLTLRKIAPGESGVTDTAVAAASILAVVLLVIAVVTVAVIVIMFLIRILYLWILIILSPLAFMLAAAPGVEGKFNEWWSKFIRYAFVGPILAFFLWLSFSIMAAVPPGGNLATNNNIPIVSRETGFLEPAGNTSATITGIGQSDQLLSYGIAIALLILSLTTANNIGVRGGTLAADALSKIKSGGLKLGKLAGLGVATGGVLAPLAAVAARTKPVRGLAGLGKKAAFGKVKEKIQDYSTAEGAGRLRRSLKYFTKDAWEGVFARGEQKRKWAAEKAKGAGRQAADTFFTRKGFMWRKEGVRGIPWREIAEHKIEQEQIKEFSQFSKERFMEFAERVLEVEGEEGKRLRRSVFLASADKGYLDDLMNQDFFKRKYQKLGQEKYGYDGKVWSNDVLINDFMYDYLEGTIRGEGKAGTGRVNASQDTMRVLDDLEDIGRKTNHWEYMGHSNFRPDLGNYERNDVVARGNKAGNVVDADDKEIKLSDGATIKAGTMEFDVKERVWRAETSTSGGATVELAQEALQNIDWHNPNQESFAIGELNKLGARDKTKIAPHTVSSLTVDDEGKGQWGGPHGRRTSFQRKILQSMKGESNAEVQHAQARMKYALFKTDHLSSAGGVALTPEQFEEVEANYRDNPDFMRSNFAMLSGDRDHRKGFSVEITDAEGNVVREEIFGDPEGVRDWQKTKWIKSRFEEVIPMMKDRDPRQRAAGENDLAQFLYLEGKLDHNGVLDQGALDDQLGSIARRYQSKLSNINENEVQEADVRSMVDLVRTRFADLETKFKGVGTGSAGVGSAPPPAAPATPPQPASPAASATPPAGPTIVPGTEEEFRRAIDERNRRGERGT